MKRQQERNVLDEVFVDFWQLYESRKQGSVFIIPTNGSVNAKGKAVMGRGLAYDASQRYDTLAMQLGDWIREAGNKCRYFPTECFITFPVKEQWFDTASLYLIGRSCRQTNELFERHCETIQKIFIPHVGCGNGRLQWRLVRPILENHCEGNYTIVSRKGDR
jgi:hypothetical protein